MRRVKYGVIGLGFFGEKHLDVLSALPNVEIIGICTRRKWRLEELARKYNVPRTFTDYHELLSDREIEAVSVVTHIETHKEPAILALNSGKHLLLEKPMAENTADCDAIIEAARKADRLLMVGHICRFDVRYALAKERIKKGEIGKIVYLYARRNIPASVSSSVLEKIGPIMGDGVHDTDLMLWYTNSRVKSVYATTVNVRNLKNPDIGAALYKFEDGATGVIENVWFLPEKTPFNLDARMEIIGTKGAIYIEGPGASLAINNETGWQQPETVYWPRMYGWCPGALKEEISYFINCIISGQKPTIITPEESRAAVEVVAAAEESARTGKVITL